MISPLRDLQNRISRNFLRNVNSVVIGKKDDLNYRRRSITLSILKDLEAIFRKLYDANQCA